MSNIRIKLATAGLAALLTTAMIGGLLPILPTQKAGAVAGAEFRAGRITDDVVFFTSNTMGAYQIQQFLVSKVPVCETNHPGGTYPPPYVCLKDYRETTPVRAAETGLCNGFPGGNKSSADIIYEVGVSCGVNPQILLILLQKEQSLVTDTWPYPIQYRSATGYGCPDTAPCDAEYYGFFNQVYMAARQYRYYAKSPGVFSYRTGRNNNIQYNPSTACGSSSVYIQTQATAGLYNYTPYQPNQAALNNLYGTGDSCSAYGNRNFWRMFNDWFGSPVIGNVPSPLYKSTTTQQIYAIAGGIKYPVPDFMTMVNYGLHKYAAADVSDSFLTQYSTAPTLTSVAKKSNDSTGLLFLFDDGKRYPIAINDCRKLPDNTPITTTSWGIDCFNANVTKSLANELIDTYTTQDIQLPSVVLNAGTVWKMEGGKKRRITDPLFVDVLGGWGQARWMKDNNVSVAEGKLLVLNDSLMKFDNSPTLYFLSNTKLRPIPGPGEYLAWGLNKKSPLTFPASYNTSEPLDSGPSLQFFTKTGDNVHWLLSNGIRMALPNPSDWPLSNETTGTDSAIATLPIVPYKRVYRSESGTIFSIFNQNKYVFMTPDDFFYLGFRAEDIMNVAQGVENAFGYGGGHLSSGRLYKIAGQPNQIYYVYGAQSLRVNSTNYPGLPYDKLITVDATTAARYPVVGTYAP